MTINTEMRGGNAQELMQRLRGLNARKMDVFHPVSQLQVTGGRLILRGAVTTSEGGWDGLALDLSDLFVQGLATKLSVPVAYLRRCLTSQNERVPADMIAGLPVFTANPIFDQTVNYWLSTLSGNVLVRAYVGDAGTGLARAFLSDQFLTVDNYDMALAAFAGIRDAGVHAELVGADLTDRNMWLRFSCPEITADGGDFVRGYHVRRGHEMLHGADRPLIEAGVMMRNSEVGAGLAETLPWFKVQVCTNGLCQYVDAVSVRHLTKRQEAGVRFASDTVDAQIQAITMEMRDAVRTFCSSEYLHRKVAEINDAAAVELDNPVKAIDHVVKLTRMSEADADALAASFMVCGQATVGGLVHALTDLATQVEDVEKAAEFEKQAEQLFAQAGTLARL